VIRKLGFVLTGFGALLILWVAVTLWRGDPITSLYTRYEQHGLAARLTATEKQWRQVAVSEDTATKKRAPASALQARIRREAIGFRKTLHNGDPIGRIIIGRIGLDMVVVQGTTEGDLAKGPGHYDAASGESTGLPGMGGVVAIAGHRTTFLHPFRYINDLKVGDYITVVMPYGTFHYRVYAHEVVPSTDWRILQRRSFEELVLSACHPLYSATHRWVVFARLAGGPSST
jgi:sortase A